MTVIVTQHEDAGIVSIGDTRRFIVHHDVQAPLFTEHRGLSYGMKLMDSTMR